MTLEGIIGIIIGLGSLYYAWRQYKVSIETKRTPRKTPAAQPARMPARTPVAAKPVQLRGDVPEQLLISFEAAKGMTGMSNRDNALDAVAKRAMDLGRIDFAIAVANGVISIDARDDLLIEIVRRALEKKQFQLARKASKRIISISKKDYAKKLIIKAAHNERA